MHLNGANLPIHDDSLVCLVAQMYAPMDEKGCCGKISPTKRILRLILSCKHFLLSKEEWLMHLNGEKLAIHADSLV